jgi:hypothetical protein
MLFYRTLKTSMQRTKDAGARPVRIFPTLVKVVRPHKARGRTRDRCGSFIWFSVSIFSIGSIINAPLIGIQITEKKAAS